VSDQYWGGWLKALKSEQLTLKPDVPEIPVDAELREQIREYIYKASGIPKSLIFDPKQGQ